MTNNTAIGKKQLSETGKECAETDGSSGLQKDSYFDGSQLVIKANPKKKVRTLLMGLEIPPLS